MDDVSSESSRVDDAPSQHRGIEGKEDSILFKDLVGVNHIIHGLQSIRCILRQPKAAQGIFNANDRPFGSLLLHGPKGCGKTTLVHALANECGAKLYRVEASRLKDAPLESLKELFEIAFRNAPSIIFVDDIDAFAASKESEDSAMVKEFSRRISYEHPEYESGPVLVVGATNRPDAVARISKWPITFIDNIVFGVPDETERADMLSVLTRNLKCGADIDLLRLSTLTRGFVVADLVRILREAIRLSKIRITELLQILEEQISLSEDEMMNPTIYLCDFEGASRVVEPYLVQDRIITVPRVKWDQVGGLVKLKQLLEVFIIQRIKFPESFKADGLDFFSGRFLLYGPPGCGKTLIAEAVANEAGANFMVIQASEFMHTYHDEPELAMETVFGRARTCSPCILFFDALDGFASINNELGGFQMRCMYQLLAELERVEERKENVYVIGATDRPDLVNPALIRTGLNTHLYVPLPTPEERGMILTSLAKKMQLVVDDDVSLMALGKDDICEGLSGADLCSLIVRASGIASEEQSTIKERHLRSALGRIAPSVSIEQIHFCQQFGQSFRARAG